MLGTNLFNEYVYYPMITIPLVNMFTKLPDGKGVIYNMNQNELNQIL